MHSVNITYDILFLMIVFFVCLFFGRILRFVLLPENIADCIYSLPSTLKAFKKRILRTITTVMLCEKQPLKLLNIAAKGLLDESVDQR